MKTKSAAKLKREIIKALKAHLRSLDAEHKDALTETDDDGHLPDTHAEISAERSAIAKAIRIVEGVSILAS